MEEMVPALIGMVLVVHMAGVADQLEMVAVVVVVMGVEAVETGLWLLDF
jgi:hypothetical protein